MPSNVSPSTRTSVVSVDPAVASHITNTRSPTKSSHARAGSSPGKPQAGSLAGHLKGHNRANSVPGKHHVKRSASLRRTKNSTEILRQRSRRGDDGTPTDMTEDPKRGRNFTVTNVGTGGMLYLRPSGHQGSPSQHLTTLVAAPHSAPLAAPATLPLMSADDKGPSRSTTSRIPRRVLSTRTRSVSPKRLLEKATKAKESLSAPRPPHIRSQSFSTLDESRRSLSGIWPKTLRIVINRHESVEPQTEKTDLKPALEIPIPHYRLGVPRFSSHGTPMLRNSAFSRASSTQSIKRISSVRHEATNAAPPPASLKAFAKITPANLYPESIPVEQRHSKQRNVAEDVHRASKSVSIGYAPSIYDELNEVYNDSSVVRFAHDVRDVTAATPARIIAQISSESFMDYELVSDFFLTFRSYMSTAEVLDLLLARLAWAIGRMSDDGRIIRIRTFAALRHWILNYFMDDFVPHRALRIRFCEEVNDLYYDVKNKHIGGPSDLKILQDLKRCWNGRCSLYWDSEDFNMDSNQDADLVPGGVLGSRNPTYTHIRELRPSASQMQLLAVQSAPLPDSQASPVDHRSTAMSRHRPHASITSGAAESLLSEQSIQPHSCSIPLPMTRTTAEGPTKLRKPQPANVQERRQKAPSDLKVTTSRSNSRGQHHRRGGNSIDSTRERTPLTVPVPQSAVPLPEPFDGSIVRGFVYAPIEPFVQIPPQMPLSPAGPIASDQDVMEPQMSMTHLPQGGPAVKNVFGSIRRALGGKQGPSEMTLIAISNPQSNPSLQPKRSQLPLGTSRSNDQLRHRSQIVPIVPVRIDLLCAAAIESYQDSLAASQNGQPTSIPQDLARTQMLPPGGFSSLSPHIQDIDRVQSHITAQSGSILIVDGTALRAAVMSGTASSRSQPSGHSDGTESTAVRQDSRHPSYDTQIAFQDEPEARQLDQEQNTTESSKPASHQISSEQTPARTASTTLKSGTDGSTAQNSSRPGTASTTHIQRNKSLTSSVARLGNKTSREDTASIVSPAPGEQDTASEGASLKLPTQMLRRMPGGDLRRNQHVHDLESVVPHHESLDSAAETVSSHPESLLVLGNAPVIPPYSIPQSSITAKDGLKKVSMIHTHSSQHLRPSFEAAVAGFSAIPDDDDGGLEATLLKLEGKYEKKSPDIDASPSTVPTETFSAGTESTVPTAKGNSSPLTSRSNMSQVKRSPGASSRHRLSDGIDHQPRPLQMFAHKQAVFGLPTESDAESEASERSVPLLQRISVPESNGAPGLLDTPHHAQNRPGLEVSGGGLGIQHIDHPGGFGRPLTAHTDQSFLLDEDEHLSDLSSEMSVDIVNYSEAMGSASSPLLVAPGTAISGLEIPSHPLAHSSFVNLPIQSNLALDGNGDPLTEHPLTPDMSPSAHRQKKSVTSPERSTTIKEKSSRTPLKIGPAHIPFILACDSQMLAQQLTIIEQSALTEVEWADLVAMRWSNQPASALDWAEYVTKENIKGVDLVVTRFNMMVKWALSEIVLTQNVHERVRVVSKLIHVAAHARRLHNYATMLQLTIALTSIDCTRLSQTWQLVPDPDKSLLKNMEVLIQPIRNFHDLRLEMESADLTDGCIPFIGLYVHDLTYNAQKPAEIDAGKNRPPLINFERFRTTAVIVKGLLRLIDASSRYEFEPLRGVIERCLWLATLDDERIRTLSRELEIVT